MSEPRPFHVGSPDLRKPLPEMREPVVDGLFRRGEVVNWIASPKVGKTWMLYTLLLAVCSGRQWIGRNTSKGRVLLIDNELHPETGIQRLHKVATGVGADLGDIDANLSVAWLRGASASLEEIEATVREYPRGTFRVIALDAFYRLIPKGTDENANGDMTQIYNHLDRIAAISGASIINVHHASKGDQTGKATTDVGAGAGSISRATDTHVVFLRHEEDGCVVMSAECRSFQRPAKVVLRVQPPSVTVEPELDPEALWSAKRNGKRERVWTVEEFVAMFIDGSAGKVETIDRAMSHGVAKARARELLEDAIALELVVAEVVQDGKKGRPKQVLRRG
jgi:hypothetical protein